MALSCFLRINFIWTMETILTPEILDAYDRLFALGRREILRTMRQVGDDFETAHNRLMSNPILHENFVVDDVFLNMRYFNPDDKENTISNRNL